MERIDKSELTKSSNPSAITTPRPSPNYGALSELLLQMKNRYEKPVDTLGDRLWLQALSKYPIETVRKALIEHMADPTITSQGFPVCKSFPMEGEVIARIERMRQPKSDYRDPRKPYDCEACSDTGWRSVPQGQSKETAVRRCECRRTA
jgi:hypothetical protein